MPEPVRALRELRRVLRPGGRAGIALWAGLDTHPGFARLREALERRLGPAAARVLDLPYGLPDAAAVAGLARDGGFDDVRVEVDDAVLEWDSVDAVRPPLRPGLDALGGLRRGPARGAAGRWSRTSPQRSACCRPTRCASSGAATCTSYPVQNWTAEAVLLVVGRRPLGEGRRAPQPLVEQRVDDVPAPVALVDQAAALAGGRAPAAPGSGSRSRRAPRAAGWSRCRRPRSARSCSARSSLTSPSSPLASRSSRTENSDRSIVCTSRSWARITASSVTGSDGCVAVQALPGELLGAARVRAGGVQQVVERVLVGRLAGGLELVVEVLEEVDPADLRQLQVGRLAEQRLLGVLEHHLQRVADRAREEQRDVVRARSSSAPIG